MGKLNLTLTASIKEKMDDDDVESILLVDGEEKHTPITLDYSDYKQANEILNIILRDSDDVDVEAELNWLIAVVPGAKKRLFLYHLSVIFLNRYLNRLDMLDDNVKENSIKARIVIKSLLD